MLAFPFSSLKLARRSGRPLLLMLALTLGACSARDGAQSATSDDARAIAAADSSLPPITPTTAAGLLAHARDGDADVTIVNVWATWCGPCREEFPAMLATAARHEGRVRLFLLSADFDDQVAQARAFLREQGVTDPSWIKQENDQQFIDSLHPQWSGALPATLVFDRKGRLSAFWEGGADSARFEAAVRQALTPDGGPS